MATHQTPSARLHGDGLTDSQREVQRAVVGMYTRHPSPSVADKLAYASRRMELRLHCCGVEPGDYDGRRVLDAGCGTGEYSCWFATRGADVTGIDLSDGSLEEARAFARQRGIAGVRFEKRSVLDTGFPDGSFDLIYCTGVLHHTPDPFGGLRELRRVLRPGGKVLISMYNAFGFLPREIRRQIARLIGGADLDRRVRWGRRLFPLTARRLTRARRNDPASALYDYFAIPHETLHTVGGLLRWFDRLGLEYTGSFAPAVFRDYPALFLHRSYGQVETRWQSRILSGAARLTGRREMTRRRPGPVSRALVQLFWLLTRVDVCCVCGRKKACPADARDTQPARA